MAGFNLLNQSTTAPVPPVTPLSNTGLNTSTFGSTGNQANLTFGSSTNTGGSLFGAAPNVTVTQSGLSFGSTPSFGSLTTTSNVDQNKPTFGSLNFSSNAAPAQTGLSFGTPNATQPGFSLTPSTPSAASNSLFGTTAQNNPTSIATGVPFNTTQQPSLNTSAAATTAGGLNISFGSGNPTQPLSVGASNQAQSLSFGTANVSQSSPFGGATVSQPSPFGGATVSQPSLFGGATVSQPSQFGMATVSQPSQFGGATVSQPSQFGGATVSQPSQFGGATVSQPSQFGGATVSQPSQFGGATVSQPSPFGGSSTSQPLSFATGLKPASATTVTTSQPASSILSSSSSAPSSLLFSGLTTSIASSAPTTTTQGLFGISSASTTGTTAAGIFSWQKPGSSATASSSAPSVGLGGIDHTAVTTAQSSTNTVVSVKEQPVPNEIQQTVVAFKEYVKTQKNLSSEVARSSAEPLTKLTQQIASLNNLVLTLGSVLSQQKFTAEKIKIETIKSLNDYELAQKIKDSPVASEERLYSIRKYFAEKISAFEESTKVLQEKIEYVYQHVITLPQENSLSAEALKLIVKKLHDSFVVISARAYKLHNDMQLLKVQYLTLRNQYVKDNSSISFSLHRELQLPLETSRTKTPADFSMEGPNPFSRTGNGSFNSLLLTSQHRNFPATTSTTKEWGVPGLSNISKSFNFADFSTSSGFDQNSSASNLSSSQQFSLQKPPVGNKRGKR